MILRKFNLSTIAAIVATNVVVMATPAQAALTVDQSQTRVDTSRGGLAIGGNVQQRLAQSFKVGRGGPLSAVGLPVWCESGDLIIDIVELSAGEPSGSSRGQTVKPASEFGSAPAGFVTITLDTPISVATGEELAIVLRNETGECGIRRAPPGDSYADGHGWFESAPNFAGWATLDLKGALPTESADLPFQTFINVPSVSDGGCFVPGFGNVPADPYSGACRCFQDEVLRENRCGILHPDFYILREFPLQLNPGELYLETWTFTPLTQLDGPVRMTLEGGGRSKPVYRDFGYNSKPGVAETKTYKIRAPKKINGVPGIATFDYGMRDATDQSFKFFGLDTSITKDDFKQ